MEVWLEYILQYSRDIKEREIAFNQLNAFMQDANKSQGLFGKLYKSSGFEEVMASITSIFQETGQITAANIEKIASKQEDLNYLLKIGAEHLENANINSAGLASIFTEIAQGHISADMVTNNLVNSLSTAKQSIALDQQALNYASDLNLGSNGDDFLSYFQKMGKEYYSLEKSNWGFNSESLRNMVNLLGNREIRDAYYKANRSGEVKFPQLMKQMPSYFTDFLDTMAGKKGKGGGGPADVFSFLFNPG